MITKGIFAYLNKKPRIMIIPTDEELMIAEKTYRLVKSGKLS